MRKQYSKWIAVASVLGCFFLLFFAAGKAESDKCSAAPLAVSEQTIDLADSIGVAKLQLQKEKIQELEIDLQKMMRNKSGNWNVYVKDLSTGDVISLNDTPAKAASLIKLFVMAYAYEHLDTADEWVGQNLFAMITYSDNEAYNSLVRKCGNGSFVNGAVKINQWLEEHDYQHTRVYNTLEPSRSAPASIAPYSNPTSAEECGRLLEEIYNGTCVAKEASKEMLDLLCQQKHISKIPQGIPDGVTVANKTGEAGSRQHDVAIVFGPETDYILCIMSEGCYSDSAIFSIREISEMVYKYLQ